ncbi:PIG-L deacetylase family protein [Qipengyuania oceanensis]|uniref:PIG-L family deacetylase n=1 Tax=Qipengyuania oceanensis TaxID=1463597 RepID=A0A844YEZ2_9SPHN|nr:PIG-L deacetylase family protein [Qipengyuania oceanensis]MXO63100.1 PIG-L family deacetylase [Qipengyuania oceanensis]
MVEAPVRNLVVVAHPDDEVLGFGATGAQLASQGERVHTLLMCSGADARNARPSDDELRADCLAAHRHLGFEDPCFENFPNIRFNTVPHVELVQAIEEQIAAIDPHRIFTHFPGDLNDDHGHVARACLAAARLSQRRSEPPGVRAIYLMETQSSTDWSFPAASGSFAPDTFVEVGANLDRKIEALACYRGVMRAYPHSRSEKAIRALATARGAQAGLDRAEAFMTAQAIGLR